ncbi:MAG: sortase [Candidatus Saccharimonadales bacterium]
MRFRHKKGSSLTSGSHRASRGVLLIVSIAAFAAGIYLLILVLTPNIPFLFPVEEINAKQLPKPAENRVYIPKIGVNVPLLTGGAEALEKGSWHRFPERGDPVEGGNFIVSAHRFSLGATPGKTRQKSPFYHIDKLDVGDQIIVDFDGKRYGYEITTHEEVKPTQVEIEAQITSSQPVRLTLYTCTLKGETDGREVFFAKPLGEVDENGNVARTD